MTSVLYAALLDEDAISIYNREVVDDAPAATAPALTLRARVECKGGPMWIAANPAASRLYACTLKTSELVRWVLVPDIFSNIRVPSLGLIARARFV